MPTLPLVPLLRALGAAQACVSAAASSPEKEGCFWLRRAGGGGLG